jgi:N-acetyl-gamma-glutamyl-phosphate reductase
MIVSMPLFPRLLARKVGPADVHAALAEHYAGERFVRVLPLPAEQHLEDGALSPLDCNDTNRLDLLVFGQDDRILIAARLDNLGKGASGAAVQCLNLMLGADESAGLA